jgi:hypothetical protein
MPKKSMKSKNRLKCQKFNETLNFHKSKSTHGNNKGNSKKTAFSHTHQKTLAQKNTHTNAQAQQTTPKRDRRDDHGMLLLSFARGEEKMPAAGDYRGAWQVAGSSSQESRCDVVSNFCKFFCNFVL